jgi:hypothetical protein
MNEISKIKKIIEIVDRKYLSKMFEDPIQYEIVDVRNIRNHYIVTIGIPSLYLDTEPYEKDINDWWKKLMIAKEFYRHIFEIGSLNIEAKKIK